MLKGASSVYIVAAKRTPFGAFGGSLKSQSATALGTAATQAALASTPNLSPDMIDHVYFGNVIQSNKDAAYLARHVGLQCGIPIATPALTLNRLCGSGFETVIQGSNAIQLGQAEVVVCGGTENMSAAPLSLHGNDARWGVKLGGGLQLEDMLWAGLTDAYAGTPMGITAENLAKEYDITREQCDEFAVRSQTTWGKAKEAGHFDLEMAPMEVKGRKGMQTIDTDEHPRPETTLEKISTLKPVFQKDGAVTAANASGICDGAGSIILASEKAVQEHNLQPLARLAAHAVVGCEPTIMGIGPVPAIQQALQSLELTVHSTGVDRIEINEAFAAQCLACVKALELDLDSNHVNVNGGAISLGHPLGASGSRITAHLANEFGRTEGSRYHVGAACIGGGQGIALVLERT